MSSFTGSEDWILLFRELRRLHNNWKRGIRHSDSPWVRGVLMAIETGRNRLKDGPRFRIRLARLVQQWNKIGVRKKLQTVSDSMKGIDYGVRLVADRAHRYLKATRSQLGPVHQSKTRRRHERKRC